MSLQADPHADRRIYSVAEFNARLGTYVRRVRNVWVEGELSELRRNEAWKTVFLTLKDRETGHCLSAQMMRSRYDALAFQAVEGEVVHVQGRLDLWEARSELVFRAIAIERLGAGDHLVALERLKRALAAEGLFADERKRALPRFPRAVGLLTGVDAAARGDVIAAIGGRFPSVRLVVGETRVQGPAAPAAIVRTLAELCARDEVDVVIVARGGGSIEDLLPFSDERVVRAIASAPVPVVSAVGHEQDTPLCDLAADVRAATPTAAARLVVPDAAELRGGLLVTRKRLAGAVRRRLERDREVLERRRARLHVSVRRLLVRDRERLDRVSQRLALSPQALLERRRTAIDHAAARLQTLSPRRTLQRGYAIVRSDGATLRAASETTPGALLEIELAAGSLTGSVVEIRS